MEKKKVLFITPSLCHGGLERSQIIMLEMLDKEKYDLSLYTYLKDLSLLPIVPKEVRVITDEDKSHYFRNLKAIFLSCAVNISKLFKIKKLTKILSENLKKYIHLQKAMRPSRDIFKNEEFDVVVSNAIGICTEMALHIKAKKRIVFYRASIDMHHEMLANLFPQYDRIVGVSEGVKEMLSTNYPEIKKKITLIRNFVDFNEIIEKSLERCSIDFPDNKLIISTCGRLSEEKGFDLAVGAAAILKERNINFVWYFIGDGSDREKLEEQIKALCLENEIIITGYTNNPFPIIKMSDIYVQPSYHESFGRTIKEALVLGRKIVSTDTVGAREILGDEKYGLKTAINSEAVADGIIKAINKQFEHYSKEDNDKEKEEFLQRLEEILT